MLLNSMRRSKQQRVHRRDQRTHELLAREDLSLEQLFENYIKSVDKGSRSYEQTGSEYRLQVEKGIFLREVRPSQGEIVLDGGCGTGHHTPDLLPFGITMIGCDRSEESLRVYRERCAGVGNGHLHLIATNVNNLPFASETFDRIICRHVLQHIPFASGRLSVLQEFHRTLKTDGWLHIVTYNRTVRDLLTGRKEGIIKKRYYYYLYSLSELISDVSSIFSRRPKVRGIVNTLPELPHLGPLGAWIDQKISIFPLISCMNAYVLLASIRK